MLVMSHDKRRAMLMYALEIALGSFDGDADNHSLKLWTDLVLEFQQHKPHARTLLNHLKSGAVLVVALADPPAPTPVATSVAPPVDEAGSTAGEPAKKATA